MHLPIVNLLGEPDPLEVVEARGLAVHAAAVTTAALGLGDDHHQIVELAAPLIAWVGLAASGEDLFTRAEAVKRYTDAVDRGALSGVRDGAALAQAVAAIYAVLTPAGVRSGAPPVGRALYAIRNLLLAGTEPGQLDPDSPGPTWDALVACAARFDDKAAPALTPAEYATALRLVMGASPRPGPAGFMCVACGFPIVPGTTDRFDIFIVPPGSTLADARDDEETELAGAAVPAAAASAFRRQHPDAHLVLHCAADPAAEAARHDWDVTRCGAAGPGGCLSCHPDDAVWWAARWRPGGSAAGRSPGDNAGAATAFGPDPSPVAAGPGGDGQ